MTIEIKFGANWVDANRFERALQRGPDGLRRSDMAVHIFIPTGCSIMVDAALRLLSYVNQLCAIGKRVSLEFEAGEAGAMGYLDRMGLFDALHQAADVRPARPPMSRAELYRGMNQSLVEIAPINPDKRDDGLPRRLVDSLLDSVGDLPGSGKLDTVSFTMLGELIGNIYDHSDTNLDGFAVSQLYGGKRRVVRIAVSDSGLGIMETLRPALPEHYPALQGLSEAELLVEIFRQGLSRHGKRQGSGLKATAMHALKFNASVDVRLPSSHVRLQPAASGEYAAHAAVTSGLPLIWGTHIAFDFALDGLEGF